MRRRLQSLETVLTQLQPAASSSSNPSRAAPSQGHAQKEDKLLRQLKESRKQLTNLQKEKSTIGTGMFKRKPGFVSVCARRKDGKVIPKAVVSPMTGSVTLDRLLLMQNFVVYAVHIAFCNVYCTKMVLKKSAVHV